MKRITLPDTLAVFPLPKALLLPRARLPLHLFEPRYLAMLDDVLKTPERLVGMVQPLPAKASELQLHQIGCAGRLTQFSETEDGRYFITLTGTCRFRIADEIEGFTPYRRVRPNWAGFDRDMGDEEHDKGFDRDNFMDLLCRYLTHEGMDTDWDSLRDAEDEMLINSLSMMLDFNIEDKQALLEAPCLETRRETLVTLMEFALHRGDKEDRIQ